MSVIATISGPPALLTAAGPNAEAVLRHFAPPLPNGKTSPQVDAVFQFCTWAHAEAGVQTVVDVTAEHVEDYFNGFGLSRFLHWADETTDAAVDAITNDLLDAFENSNARTQMIAEKRQHIDCLRRFFGRLVAAEVLTANPMSGAIIDTDEPPTSGDGFPRRGA